MCRQTQTHTTKAGKKEGKSEYISAAQNNSLLGQKTQFTADGTDSDSIMTAAANAGTALHAQQQCSNFICRAHSGRRILSCDARNITDSEKLEMESYFDGSLNGQNYLQNCNNKSNKYACENQISFQIIIYTSLAIPSKRTDSAVSIYLLCHP